MADNYLITGYWGEPHVTAENDRGIHAGIFGAGRFVLPVGEQFRAEYIGNNTVRVYDGKLMNNGAAAGIPAGEYVDLLIANASQGMKRNDLIVFQYSKDASTQVESGSFVLVKGAESSGTPADPTLTQADLLSGNASLDQMPLWRVVVSGTAIAAPVKVFTLADNIPGIKGNITKNDVGLGNVDNVKQYSTSNPPPYPVTSVNGETGAVKLLGLSGLVYSSGQKSILVNSSNNNKNVDWTVPEDGLYLYVFNVTYQPSAAGRFRVITNILNSSESMITENIAVANMQQDANTRGGTSNMFVAQLEAGNIVRSILNYSAANTNQTIYSVTVLKIST